MTLGTGDRVAVMRLRMDRARESLSDARLLLDNGRLSGAINRL